MSGHIYSHLAGKHGNTSLSEPLVMDITYASEATNVPVDVWPQNVPDSTNQQWDFVTSPAFGGYFHIRSKLDGSHLTATPAGQPLTAVQTSDLGDVHLWRAVADPAGSGYSFLQSKALNLVAEITGGSPQQGTNLTLHNAETGGTAHQLWKADFPSTIPLDVEISTNQGTGTGTAQSGGNECAYTVGLGVSSDGTCHFSGRYTNRGDTLLTAPPQNFAVAAVVHDLVGNWYSFVIAGFVYSAPQANDTFSWDTTHVSSLIRDNWNSIALRKSITVIIVNGEADSDSTSAAGEANVQTIYGMMQTAVTKAGGGNIGVTGVDNFVNPPNSIYAYIGPVPYSGANSSKGPGGGGSTNVGWPS